MPTPRIILTAARLQLAAQTQLEWLAKQLSGREFMTGPRSKIAGIITQAGVDFGTLAAGLNLDLALAERIRDGTTQVSS